MHETDILISGGGVAGLTAASAFGAAGFRVLIVEPSPPVTDLATPGADLRTTAFLTPSVKLLQAAGLWERLLPFASALQVMRIVDAGGPLSETGQPVARMTRDFVAAEISDQPFGYNLPNWLLRREMVARLSELPNVTFRPGLATTSMTTRATEARVTLSDGAQVTARLVIAADGRNSTMRQAAGIGVKTIRYGQKAVVCAVTHDQPHGNVSTEIHRSGGPFTLVPLPDHQGRPASAVVWMERAAQALGLATLPDAAFQEALNARSCGVLGPLTLVSGRATWPIITQWAHRMSGERLALMAEAAHVVPPIGAQGLNMSLRDLGSLLDLATASPATLGDAAMLDAYHRARHTDVTARALGIDALNRASMAEAQPLRNLRAMGLGALHAITPIRRTLMKAGLGLG
ncbi:UbiH/UbiF family hydroxylase [Stagnihabitans tardus]|uniref:UbiH/UbiF family hydroxylase n=1 Tax=Stagnihabitans tardus TaxID=2699202 RepID=A0AAE4YA04_9RHOB|nr:UbiH/UbiF family hydroxylase [Stagnihabitans tardus]NBZ86215.1 UbiH/UbiF family hydroxylase [Stagnihabitans tardus]